MQIKIVPLAFALAIATPATALTLEQRQTDARCCLPPGQLCERITISPPVRIQCCPPYACIGPSTTNVGKCTPVPSE
ncbi:hypothetical protein DFH08DRAFT_967658 [Mycena albidolilacea]|uniref:Uncharacterized protein n=1 Tax=Mycena albidolilacea TaxID=1033008 RepID=A0AAD6ZL97_9AGAR|nr:hypothetical protein DFH08DRAFT_967658 [Mycena albidolilacea]